MKNPDCDDIEFENDRELVLTYMRCFLKKNFGEQCRIYEEGCIICDLWMIYNQFERESDV